MMVFAYYGYRKSKKMISENAERSSDEGNHVGKKASKERLVGIASYFKRTLVMMVVLTIIAFSMIAATLLIPNAKWSRFMQDMTMITPYTDDQTLSLLRSDWTRMESKEDYQMIYQTINEIKGENGL